MTDSTANTITLKFRSFESKILYFNGMYKLPVAAYPSITSVVAYEQQNIPQNVPSTISDTTLLVSRMYDFHTVILDEVEEVGDIIKKVENNEYPADLDFLTDMADWLGDIIIYCASEMIRYGIPIQKTLDIIMASNFSKLGADGQPIISSGKVQKGPNYWKPEPALMIMLKAEQDEANNVTVGKQE